MAVESREAAIDGKRDYQSKTTRFDEILEFGYEFAKSKITDEWVQSLIDKNKG